MKKQNKGKPKTTRNPPVSKAELKRRQGRIREYIEALREGRPEARALLAALWA